MLTAAVLPSSPKRMREENPIDRVGKIDNGRRWACQSERSGTQRGKNIFTGECHRMRHARVVSAESMQTMRVGGCDQGLTIFSRNSGGAAVRVEQEVVKMTELDRVETIDLLDQARPNRAAENIKWMRRDRENGSAASAAQRAQIGKGL